MIINIALAGRNGIGADILDATKNVLLAVGVKFGHSFNFSEASIGEEAIISFSEPFPKQSVQICKCCSAVIVGALCSNQNVTSSCSQISLAELERALGLYSNIRLAKVYPALIDLSPLKNADSIDIAIVREVLGGCYYGDRGYQNGEYGREAYDTERYSEIEIERVARTAFELAQERKQKLCSVDKANILLSSKLWRKIVHDIHEDYPDVALCDMYVDECAKQLVKNPSQFDVILASNMFGDIISELSSGIVGNDNLFPFASVGTTNFGLYGAVANVQQMTTSLDSNPIGIILSSALALRYSFNLNKEAAAIEFAVDKVFDIRAVNIENVVGKAFDKNSDTNDISLGNNIALSALQMSDLVINNLR
ncbi:MAG: isocitrate/isopropylmalate family dehydrogenase [Clostridia bacterium]|nr:isocitrate/isopropylmalate family dehydrogenase [Clostridia bacterium]